MQLLKSVIFNQRNSTKSSLDSMLEFGVYWATMNPRRDPRFNPQSSHELRSFIDGIINSHATMFQNGHAHSINYAVLASKLPVSSTSAAISLCFQRDRPSRSHATRDNMRASAWMTSIRGIAISISL